MLGKVCKHGKAHIMMHAYTTKTLTPHYWTKCLRRTRTTNPGRSQKPPAAPERAAATLIAPCVSLAAQRTKAAALSEVVSDGAYMEGAERDTSPTKAHELLSPAAPEDFPGEASSDCDTAGSAPISSVPAQLPSGIAKLPGERG